MSVNGKNIHEIEVFLESNLTFKIRIFIWGLANNLHTHTYKKYEKSGKFIILSNLI